ncbi:MAG: acyltransferase [Planctomycetota bacterium]
MRRSNIQLPEPIPRVAGLDLLRAVAIVLVLFTHGPLPAEGELPWLLDQLVRALKRGGWIGVDLFFVLSGFLVSGLLMREQQQHGTVHVGRFLVRRGWKIYPPLAVFIAVMVVVNYVQRGYWPTDRLINQLLFIQNYRPGVQVHTWSLAVEEHAYLLIALAFGLSATIARRRSRAMRLRWIVWLFPVVAVLAMIGRARAASVQPFDSYLHQFPTHLRIDSLFIGVVIAYAYHYAPQATAGLIRRYRLPISIAGIALLLPAFIWPLETTPWVYSYGLATNYLGGALLLCAMLGWSPGTSWGWRWLMAVGRHSYSIYLWHMAAYAVLVGVLTGRFTGKPAWDGPYPLHLGLYVAVAIGSGVLLSWCIEVPTLKLRDRLSPSRSGALREMPNGGENHRPGGQEKLVSGSLGAQAGVGLGRS